MHEPPVGSIVVVVVVWSGSRPNAGTQTCSAVLSNIACLMSFSHGGAGQEHGEDRKTTQHHVYV